MRRNRTTRGCVVVAGAAVVAVALPGGAAPAWADETHRGSHNGPTVALISTGQIDDPMEDVLEHAALVQRDHHTG
ncbi:hypothetical protein ACLIYM_14830 [Streptomyces fenghuangensis]|uniref:Uncharacterized protein n=1 Tax=Streptomyces chitinivorans TaxID=1257027 RepID=A0ABW7HPS7_9ACTN|nr:hypothetical protein [Streptomyces chitinivorans]MCG3039677.1 hypothetical protein [Streptomyces sp. ICN903]MDH2410651.1 hypothetical protein [Streptomyces chitinivorans]